MSAEHWHIAQVNETAAGSEVKPEVYPDWGAALAEMRRRQVTGGPILTVRPCKGRCAGMREL